MAELVYPLLQTTSLFVNLILSPAFIYLFVEHRLGSRLASVVEQRPVPRLTSVGESNCLTRRKEIIIIMSLISLLRQLDVTSQC